LKNALNTERLVALLKCLMAAYLITGALLMLVAGLLYKFSIGENVGAFLFKGRGKPPVYLGDAGGSGLFSGHMRSFCFGGSRFFTGQQRVHHDTPELPRQRDAGRDAGIRWIYKNFVKNLSFLSKYVILVK